MHFFAFHRVCYHITVRENLDSIKKQGLIPMIGPRSKLQGKSEGIHLFSAIDVCQNALKDRLDGAFDENEALVVIEIKIPSDFPLEKESDSVLIAGKTITPNYIRTILIH